MPRLWITALLIGLGATPLAARPIDFSPHYPIEHQQTGTLGDTRPQPYAMSYADEAARSLGVQDGHWEAFNTGASDSLMPSLKGGVDNGSAMIRLQWQSSD